MTQSGGRIVMILGMHRSGTSLLARLLAGQGLPLGPDLLNRRTRDNRHGYWEQGEIVAIHEALLDGWDRTWHGPNGLLPLPAGWLQAKETGSAKARLLGIVAREVAAAGGLWGFKDPRTLRFLPLWRAIIAELQLSPVCLLAARAPGAVAASLMRRNRLSRRFAEALWAAHTIEAWQETAGDLAAVIDYDAWFTQPEAVAAHLRQATGLADSRTAAAPAVLPFIESRLRHHEGETLPAHPAFQALHTALIANAPHRPPQAALHAPIAAAAAVLREIATEEKLYPGIIELRKAVR